MAACAQAMMDTRRGKGVWRATQAGCVALLLRTATWLATRACAGGELTREAQAFSALHSAWTMGSDLLQDVRPRTDTDALAAQLDALQQNADCDDPSRRYLVFVYHREQQVNGFAALFQHYAGAQLLAWRYNRTLVELLPPQVPQLSTLPRHSAAAAHLLVHGYVKDFSEWVDVNDAWHRAPPLVCRGAKMGCFLRRPAACAVTILPAAMQREAAANSAASAGQGARNTRVVHSWRDFRALDIGSEEHRLSLLRAGRDVPRDSPLSRAAEERVVVLPEGSTIAAHVATLTHAANIEHAVARHGADASVAWACAPCASADTVARVAPLRARIAALRCALYCPGGNASHARHRFLWPALQAYLFQPVTPVEAVRAVTAWQDEAHSHALLPLLVGWHYRRGDTVGLRYRSAAHMEEYAHALQVLHDLLRHHGIGAPQPPARGATQQPPGDALPALVTALAFATDAISATEEVQRVSASAGLWPVFSTGADVIHELDDAGRRHDSSTTAELDIADAAIKWRGMFTARNSSGELARLPALQRAEVQAAARTAFDSLRLLPHATTHTLRQGYIIRPVQVHESESTDSGDGPLSVQDIAAANRTLRAWGVRSEVVARIAAAASDVARLTQGVVADIALLSHAHVLLGSSMSQVSRLASELALARGSALLPAHAFDVAALAAHRSHHPYTLPLPWCAPWQALTDANCTAL